MGSDNYQQQPPPPPAYAPPPPPMAYPPQKPPSMIPIVAGVLLIVAAVMGFYVGAVVGFIGGSTIGLLDTYIGNDPTGVVDAVTTFMMICGIIVIIFSILALLGGLMSVTRKSWAMALVGAIFGLFTIGPYFIGSVFSLVALILIAVSKDEF